MILLAAALAATVAAAESSPRAAALFLHAIRNHSSAPEYVLITLRAPGHADRVVCAEAPFLLGALRTELGPSEDALAYAEARAGNRVFELSKPRAIQNLERGYSDEVLAEVRGKLAGRGRDELAAELRVPGSALHGLYKGRHGAEWQAYRDAVAHVLLSQGVPVGRGDPVGNLYLPDVAQD